MEFNTTEQVEEKPEVIISAGKGLEKTSAEDQELLKKVATYVSYGDMSDFEDSHVFKTNGATAFF